MKKRIVSIILAIAMVATLVPACLIPAFAEDGASADITVTIKLNGGVQADSDATSIQATIPADGYVLTHANVQKMFGNIQPIKDADASVVTSTTIDIENDLVNNRLFGLFVDTDEDGVLDADETLYVSGDTLKVADGATLTCYYNPYLVVSRNETLIKPYANKDPWSEENPGGMKHNYTARDLQTLYWPIKTIGGKSFYFNECTADNTWKNTYKTVELPSTVTNIAATAFEQGYRVASVTGLENVETLGHYAIMYMGMDVYTGPIELVFGNIKSISLEALAHYNKKGNDGQIYRHFIFTGAHSSVAEADIHKIFACNGRIGNDYPTEVFFHGQNGGGRHADRELDFTDPSSIVYVPFGKTGVWYPDETEYASGKISFNTRYKADGTLLHVNMPMREMYTVTFDLNGGAGIANDTYMDAGAKSVIRGDKEVNMHNEAVYDETDPTKGLFCKNPEAQDLTKLGADKPQDPTKAGYAFLGWQDENGDIWTEEEWAAGGKAGAGVDKNGDGKIELKAVFAAKVNVTYKLNNTQPDVVLNDVPADSLLTKPEDPTAVSGYEFTGWYKDAACTEAWDFANDKVPAKDLTIYAGWKAQSIKVSLVVDGGTITETSSIVKDGDKYILSYEFDAGVATLPTPKKEGYTFEGWYSNTTDKNSKVTSIAANSSVDTLYAVYTKDAVISTVTYELDGGTLEGGKTSDDYTEGVAFELPTPTKEGYTFEGWFWDPEFSGDAFIEISIAEKGDFTIYAKWTKVEDPADTDTDTDTENTENTDTEDTDTDTDTENTENTDTEDTDTDTENTENTDTENTENTDTENTENTDTENTENTDTEDTDTEETGTEGTEGTGTEGTGTDGTGTENTVPGATESTPTGSDNTSSGSGCASSGCGSSMSIGAVALISAVAVCGFTAFRKKED